MGENGLKTVELTTNKSDTVATVSPENNVEPICQNSRSLNKKTTLELVPPNGENKSNDTVIYLGDVKVDKDNMSWAQIAFTLVPLALPSVLSMALTFGLAVIPLALIGSMIGDEALTGASVGYFIISIVAQYPLCGLTFAMDAFCSQAYGRDAESDEQGVILQRGVLVSIAFLLPVNMILCIIQEFLPKIYGEKIAMIACDFMKSAILFIIPLVMFTAFSKFCLNQLKPQLPMIALGVGIAVTPVCQYVLIKEGVHGAMLGMAITAWIQLLVIVSLTFFVKSTRKTLGTLRLKEALDWDGLKEYLQLALPSSLFVAAEASSFDVAVLLSAALGTYEGAAFSAILNTLLMFVSIAGGLSTAACAKVGSSLGANLPQCARRYVVVAVSLAVLMASLNGIIVFVLFDNILGLFGVEGDSLVTARTIRWLVPFMCIADSAQYVFQGVFSGMGQNKKGAQILITCLWVIGLPLELALAYLFGCGLTGIVGGLTIGLMLESPTMIWYVCKLDWEELAREASSCTSNLQVSDYEDDEMNFENR
ncbi:multidrug resistance protein, MATE family [Trypanosoma theileri]|uniref:Multidrug resistance protein, MATE family n=1 Tax=Trypanosoma theileri TaxID=67003 RepID=A0A1X0NM81_9TRYP|nr:multidrug resistance protein, MATE family [Trypanosoma theileri]ORC85249.1 multidrug resistance protein, MATE family [Trypanosoma theileri]